MLRFLCGLAALVVIAQAGFKWPTHDFSVDKYNDRDNTPAQNAARPQNPAHADYEAIISQYSKPGGERLPRDAASRGHPPARKPSSRTTALVQEARQRRLRVVVNLSNQQLLDICRICTHASATRTSLISTMVPWNMVWPMFKETWDRCVDGMAAQYPEAMPLKQMGMGDFEVYREDLRPRH